MTILDIELVHFGKFHQKRIRFSPKLNVIYGKNEAGKSTIHAFIRSMLFGMEQEIAEGEESLYDKYFPWDDRGGYGGSMRLQIEDHIYRIERSFLKDDRYMKLFDETANEELIPADVKLKELLEGLNETHYVNTVSIEQMKSATEPELIEELEHFIFNTSQTKNVRIDIEQAQKTLYERAEELKRSSRDNAREELQQCEKELQEVQDAYDSLQDQRYRKENRQETLKNAIGEKQREKQERMMAYERDRDDCRRQYEAARKNWEDAPKGSTDQDKNGHLLAFFLILAVLFAAAVGYLYFVQGLTEDTTVIAAGFSVMVVLSIIGALASAALMSKSRKRRLYESEIRKKLKAQLDDSMARFEACKQAVPEDPEEACAQLRDDLKKIELELSSIEDEIAQRREEYNTLFDKQQELYTDIVANDSIAQELESVELAMETLKKVAERVQETFGNRLSREASEILATITGGRYDRIQIGGTSRGIRIGTVEKLYPLGSVSRGTMEQVYLAIRVAAARLLWQKSAMPFIFDDVFAYYDDDRLESAMSMLRDCGHQVLIFSCNAREDRMLDGE